MKKKRFKPFLAVDATDHLETLKFPKEASVKLDGIRAVFHPDLGLVSRSLKPIQNKQLRDKFIDIIESADKNGVLFDGEFYHHDLTFQEITALVMTQDFMDIKTIKKLVKQNSTLLKYYEDPPDGDFMSFNNPLMFCCFDCFADPRDNFKERMVKVERHLFGNPNVEIVEQNRVFSADEVKNLFSTALEKGFEGLILRDPESKYKFGRSTLKEEGMLKVKPFETEDLKVVKVIERMENLNESFKNELNQSTKRNTKEDKKNTGIAACFEVIYNDLPMKVTLTGTEEFRKEIWENKEKYIGKIIEVKGMRIGSKDVLRHPTFCRMRSDLDE